MSHLSFCAPVQKWQESICLCSQWEKLENRLLPLALPYPRVQLYDTPTNLCSWLPVWPEILPGEPCKHAYPTTDHGIVLSRTFGRNTQLWCSFWRGLTSRSCPQLCLRKAHGRCAHFTPSVKLQNMVPTCFYRAVADMSE